jgi:hypothetical protein
MVFAGASVNPVNRPSVSDAISSRESTWKTRRWAG